MTTAACASRPLFLFEEVIMATTSTMPLHTGKGRTVRRAIQIVSTM